MIYPSESLRVTENGCVLSHDGETITFSKGTNDSLLIGNMALISGMVGKCVNGIWKLVKVYHFVVIVRGFDKNAYFGIYGCDVITKSSLFVNIEPDTEIYKLDAYSEKISEEYRNKLFEIAANDQTEYEKKKCNK